MSVARTVGPLGRQSVLDDLSGGLVVSCQPVAGGPMDHDDIVLAMALASQAGGAVAVRIEGARRVGLVAPKLQIPVIGLVKCDLANSPVRITPRSAEVAALADAGAWMIASDATHRHRPEPIESLLDAIHARGCLAMADCATVAEGMAANRMGFDCVGSTLSGYTAENTVPSYAAPDSDMVRQLSQQGVWVIAEGRIASAAMASQALSWGAKAVTVGSALTRLESMVSIYVQGMQTRQ